LLLGGCPMCLVHGVSFVLHDGVVVSPAIVGQ